MQISMQVVDISKCAKNTLSIDQSKAILIWGVIIG